MGLDKMGSDINQTPMPTAPEEGNEQFDYETEKAKIEARFMERMEKIKALIKENFGTEINDERFDREYKEMLWSPEKRTRFDETGMTSFNLRHNYIKTPGLAARKELGDDIEKKMREIESEHREALGVLNSKTYEVKKASYKDVFGPTRKKLEEI